METNKLLDITNDEYHSSEGYSKSALITYRDSPVRFYKEYVLKYREFKQSDDFMLGQLVHTILLEPHKMGEYIPAPRFNKKTNKGKEEFEKFNAYTKEQNVTPVDANIYAKSADMAKAIVSDRMARNILEDAQCEKSIFWNDSDTGFIFKSRPDIIKGGIVADVKTCKDVTYKAFQRSCVDYGYFLQAAMAKIALEKAGREFEKFVFICCDKTSHEVVLYALDEPAIDYGLRLFASLSQKLKHEFEDDSFLKSKVKLLTPPAWAEWELNNG